MRQYSSSPERRVAAIVGGVGGIGRAVLRRLAADDVTSVALDLPTAIEAAGDELTHTLATDVTDADQVSRSLDEVVARHGRLEVLVNAAGVVQVGGVDEVTPDQQVQATAYTSRLVGYPDDDLRMAQFALPDGNPDSGHVIELAEYRHPRDGENPPGTSRVNSAHIALQVDDIDAVCERIEHEGGTLLSPPQAIEEGINTGGRAVYARDPDGITIELVVAPVNPAAPEPSRAR